VTGPVSGDDWQLWLRAENLAVARIQRCRSVLKVLLREARTGALEPEWRQTRPAAALDQHRTAPPSAWPPTAEEMAETRRRLEQGLPVDVFAPLKGIEASCKGSDAEHEYLALLEPVDATEWDWEPARGPAVGWHRALGCWYGVSVDCVNAEEAVEAARHSQARRMGGYQFGACLAEDRWRGPFVRERDLLAESYEAALAGFGVSYPGVGDWVENSRARVARWSDEHERRHHLAKLDSEFSRLTQQTIPTYWQHEPPPPARRKLQAEA
jgi:hypothetical protein